MNDVKQHRRNRNRALVERTETIEELIARCRKMTPEQFAQLSQYLLRRLTPDQRADIAAGLTPAAEDTALPRAGERRSAPGSSMPAKKARPRARSIWRRMLSASLVWGTTASLTVIAVLTVPPLLRDGGQIVRPTQSGLWPRCARLTGKTDGCVYRVSHGLSWSDAAGLLNMQEAYLRAVNQAPASGVLNAGQFIIVWRGHGRLTQ